MWARAQMQVRVQGQGRAEAQAQALGQGRPGWMLPLCWTLSSATTPCLLLLLRP